jgi:hypothetical protein
MDCIQGGRPVSLTIRARRADLAMETTFRNDEPIVRYLLGDLPEEEQIRLEDRAFSDQEYMQNILDAESDLIDEYVRGGLSESERRRFERRFLVSAERQRKVEFARALACAVPEAAPEAVVDGAARPVLQNVQTSWWKSFLASLRAQNPIMSFSLAAAAVVLSIGLSWLIFDSFRLRAQVAQLQAEQEMQRRQAMEEQARSKDLAEQLAREREQRTSIEKPLRQIERGGPEKSPAGSLIASFFLPPNHSRDQAARPKFDLPQAVRAIRLQIGLEREDQYQSFRVEIRTRQGKEVLVKDGLRSQLSRSGRVLKFTIPGGAFAGGEYELTLKGVDRRHVEDLRFYYFDVVK